MEFISGYAFTFACLMIGWLVYL